MFCAACHAENGSEATGCAACGADPLLVGSCGSYRLLQAIGRGSSGTTWRAERLQDGETFAIKEMPLQRAQEAKARELLAREAAVLRQLDHPQVPRWVEDFVAGEGKAKSLFLVQSYVPGHDLREEMASHRYDEHEVRRILADLCPVLEYLHTRSPPVIHRDLKPANIRRTLEGTLVLIDFGSVRDAIADPELGGSTVAGTFGYMAPEQYAGDASPRSDLYGLGALAVALLSRADPAKLLTPGAHKWERALDVSSQLKGLLRSLLAAHPADRPNSAGEVARRLAAMAAFAPQAAPLTSLSQRAETNAVRTVGPAEWGEPARVGVVDREVTNSALGREALEPEPFGQPLERLGPPEGGSTEDEDGTLKALAAALGCSSLLAVGMLAIAGLLVLFMPVGDQQTVVVEAPIAVEPLPSVRTIGEAPNAVPVRISPSDSKVVKPVPLGFPKAAREANLTEDKCLIEAFIRADGSVYRAEVSKCHPAFHDATLQAATTWRWDESQLEARRTRVLITYIIK